MHLQTMYATRQYTIGYKYILSKNESKTTETS
jgi:hypothetical protein